MTGTVAGFYMPQADIRASRAAVKKYSRFSGKSGAIAA
jgi:hypothetical protein